METVVKKTCQLGGTQCSNKAKLLEKNREIKRDEFLRRRTMFLIVCIRSERNVFQQVTAALLTKQNDLCLWLIPVVC